MPPLALPLPQPLTMPPLLLLPQFSTAQPPLPLPAVTTAPFRGGRPHCEAAGDVTTVEVRSGDVDEAVELKPANISTAGVRRAKPARDRASVGAAIATERNNASASNGSDTQPVAPASTY